MTEEIKAGCTRPAAGVLSENTESEIKADTPSTQAQEKETQSMIQIGKKAPDFTAPGYQNGEFINMTLSEYFGKWIVLCFYPGDFTFV